MSGMLYKKSILFLTLCILTSASLFAQSDNKIPKQLSFDDTLFYEIILTDEGIAAVDVDGNDWYFDFEQDMFVLGLMERSDTKVNVDEDSEPVENRCYIERRIKPSIKKYVVINTNEYVDHDIVVFSRVTVKGWVKGSITSYNDKVIVKSTGRVDGDINAPNIIVHDGGVVLGKLNENLLDFPTQLPGNGFLVIMIIMTTLCVILFLIIALIPKKLVVVSECLNRYKLRSTFLGLLFFFLMPIVISLIAITIIGIPIALFVPLIYVFASILGIAAFSYSIGNLVFGRFLAPGNRIFMKSFLGFALFAISWIIGITFMTDPEDSGIGIFFFVISILFSIVPVFGGIGAAVLTRFGYRPYLSWKDMIARNPENLTPAPPPMPKGPEIKPPPRRSDIS